MTSFSRDEWKKFSRLAEERHTALAQLISELLHREADAASKEAA